MNQIKISGYVTVYDPDHDCPVAEKVGSFVQWLDEVNEAIIAALGGVNLPNAEFYDWKQINQGEEF